MTKRKGEITRACADAVGTDQYIELDEYLVCWPRRDESHPQVEQCKRVRKRDGAVTVFALQDAKIFRWTECVGRGGEFFVLKRDLGQIARVDAETLEETMISAIGAYPHHLEIVEGYLYYSTKKEHPLIVRVDLADGGQAGMDDEGEYMDLKVDAWLPVGHILYGMHDDFDREESILYRIDMESFRAEKLSATSFSLDRFWEKPELLKESFTFEREGLLVTVVSQSRHSESYYELVDPARPGAVERRPLCGPMHYIWFAGGRIYLAGMADAMDIRSFDPMTGEVRVLASHTSCFARDEFGHITGERPQVVGAWLYYWDHRKGERVCVNVSEDT